MNLRPILTLTRPAGLPSVWSNCLAGWWLGGGGNPHALPLLFAGATLLYFGLVVLHDAFDVHHDRQQRRTRPVPAGEVRLRTVWRWGLALTVLGALLLIAAGTVTGAMALGLVLFALLFNALRRMISWSPVLLGVVRLFSYLLGASVAEHGISGWPLWCGIALAFYVAGLKFLADGPAVKPIPRWPIVLLCVPVWLALVMNVGPYREPALLLSAVVALWSARCLRHTYWTPEPNLPITVSGLTSGIVFVDWLAACPTAPEHLGLDLRMLSFCFLGLFGLSFGLHHWTEPRR
jgi:hypothetical protein